ncbi:helix-turn-helix domain-containing protein [Jeotgalibacillus proteolyticus]|nr:helix-turn-helix domain-containing protein [Jeotgalibacillus proteolyticus]
MSLIEKLIKQYPGARKKESVSPEEYEHFIWFNDSASDLIALPKKDLSKNEIELIKMMLVPAAAPNRSLQNHQWNRFLFGTEPVCPLPIGTPFRVIFFSFDKVPEYAEGEHPLKFVFSEESVIVPRDELNGYVVELQTQNTLSFEEVSSASQALETDLGVNIHFFVGSFHEVHREIKEVLLLELDWFNETARLEKRQPVVSTHSIFPYLIIDRFTEFELNAQFEVIFKAFEADPELPVIIRTLAENLANVSSTAKKLYLHRNSLQYRLDRFTEKTGVDLKSFHGIQTAYLAGIKWNEWIRNR